MPVGYLVGNLLLVGEVDFVDDQYDWRVGTDDSFQELLVLQCLADFGDKEEEVSVLEGIAYHSHHLLVELVVGVDNARGIGIDNLEILAVNDTHDAVACGLSLAGDNAKTFAYQGVHQGGLAHVGVADDVYKACFVHGERC